MDEKTEVLSEAEGGLPFMVARDTPILWQNKAANASVLPRDLRKVVQHLEPLVQKYGTLEARTGQEGYKDPRTGKAGARASLSVVAPRGVIVLQIPYTGASGGGDQIDPNDLRPPGPNQQFFSPDEANELKKYINQSLAQAQSKPEAADTDPDTRRAAGATFGITGGPDPSKAKPTSAFRMDPRTGKVAE